MRRDIDAAEVQELLLRPYKFGECVELHNRNVHGVLKLTETLIGGVDCSGCIFNDGIDCSGSVFQGLSWFKDVEFRASIDFSGSRFSSDARFDRANFINGADFSAATFWGVGCFDGVVANACVSMNDIIAYGNLSLAGSDFRHDAVMTNATLMGGLWMPGIALEQLRDMENCTVQGRFEYLTPHQ